MHPHTQDETHPLAGGDSFARRHIGPDSDELATMLDALGVPSLDALVDHAVPADIRLRGALNLPPARGEHEALAALKAIMSANKVFRSYIGMGFCDCITPPVIQRNILENPGWYTAYTPYQAEISQGRLEALLNFQTMIVDLTALDIANASLLDEATACAEAMHLAHAVRKHDEANIFFVSESCHPQNIAVVQTRAKSLGIEVVVGDHCKFVCNDKVFGALLQYPATDGAISDYAPFIADAHNHGALVAVAADLLALTLLKAPGEFGADIAVGSAQRFGVPLGHGGPHAGYFATRDAFKRHLPGRLVGVSKDAQGRPALRLALQTREQHIRREKATSNICTAEVLLAVMASMFAVYHGPDGLKQIARRVHGLTRALAAGLRKLGHRVGDEPFFDTVHVLACGGLRQQSSETREQTPALQILRSADEARINLRVFPDGTLGVSLDETTTESDVQDLLRVFNGGQDIGFGVEHSSASVSSFILHNSSFRRTSAFLTHPVFNSYHTETKMLRYMRKLESRDLSLCHSMIPLGSCTMKLNATAEMLPVSWPEVSKLHPFAPVEQAAGYQTLFRQLEAWLAEITGFDAVSFQPNAGSQGEYSGLLVIREYLAHRGQGHRDICLIPVSAHGTNPASATMAGLKVVAVACDNDGNIDVKDLRAKAEAHRESLAALMVTYPSTHGVFEESIREVCQIIHEHGGQVYMDGANMNAQVGLCRPGDVGADVCHLNLHKTFCIPHGGGGPGMGPICVASHLAPFLPAHPTIQPSNPAAIGAISSAPWGSASILPISWMYIAMMGANGLLQATKVAILNANYIARRLEEYFPVLYRGKHGFVAHECILDLRRWKAAGIEVEDVAKRLMDYGFHAPTISFPVPGTMMVEPTESESRDELDRFCDAMISIHGEMQAVASGATDKQNNPLKNAPHTAEVVSADKWNHPYSRAQAAYPAPWLRDHKFWPAVSRIDNVYGDRNLFCVCPSLDEEEV
jgi:glycine dehydrogenase